MLMIYTGVGFANPNDNPLEELKGDFVLNMGDRPGVPYQQLNNYNPSLTEAGVGPGYTVSVSRHHIIPRLTLSRFYNRVAELHRLPNLSGFFNSFSNSLSFYAGSNGVDCGLLGNDLVDAGNLAQAQAFGLARASGSNHALGFDTFEQFYIWLPGNLFIGPRSRSDDPGDDFELNARTIVGEDTYNRLLRAYMNMVKFLQTNDTSLLNSISADLTTVSKRQSIYSLQSEHWELKNGEYNIKKPSVSLKAIPQEENDSLSEECVDIQPSLINYLYISAFPTRLTGHDEL